MNIEITWSEFKSQVNAKSLKVQYVTSNDNYHVVAFDNWFKMYCILPIGVDNADTTDFETNYKPTSNVKIEDVDSEGRKVTRVASAKAGWTILVHSIEIETANLTGLYSKDYLGNDSNGIFCKFYNASGTELTVQGDIDTDCVKTVMLFKPNYDYEVMGGQLHQFENPTSDIRVYAVGGIIELGGAYVKEMIRGVNFKYIDTADHIVIDGKTTKLMKKDIVGVPYQANQLQLVIKHDAGYKHKIMLVLNYYRA